MTLGLTYPGVSHLTYIYGSSVNELKPMSDNKNYWFFMLFISILSGFISLCIIPFSYMYNKAFKSYFI